MEVLFVELIVFKGVLTLSATARNEKITFSPIFFLGYKGLWFAFAPYMLNFCILNFKALVKILEIQSFQSCLPLGPVGQKGRH
jgi:hypothetical protein